MEGTYNRKDGLMFMNNAEDLINIGDTCTSYEEFKEALSNVYPVYENCDGRETVFKDYQQVKIETSDGIIDGYITYVYSTEEQYS